MNAFSPKIENLKTNSLTNLNNYYPIHKDKVKSISISFLTLASITLTSSIGFVICAVILFQPLFLIGLLITTVLFSITLGITIFLLKKCFINVPKIDLNAIKNFSIKKKDFNSLTIEAHSKNSSSKEIIFISKSPSHILSFNKKTDLTQPLAGYVCSTDSIGSSDFFKESQRIEKKFNFIWNKIKKSGAFSIGEVKIFPISLSDKNYAYKTDSDGDPISEIFTTHSYLLPCFSGVSSTHSLNSFCKNLIKSYKNIFFTANKNKLKTLYLPILGIKSILEPQILTHHKKILACKILLQCLFEEVANQSSINQFVIFTDKNSIIEKIIWEKVIEHIA